MFAVSNAFLYSPGFVFMALVLDKQVVAVEHSSIPDHGFDVYREGSFVDHFLAD